MHSITLAAQCCDYIVLVLVSIVPKMTYTGNVLSRTYKPLLYYYSSRQQVIFCHYTDIHIQHVDVVHLL